MDPAWRFLWPSDGPRPAEGPPEAFVLLSARGRRTLRLASNLAYEVWLDGRFAGDGGNRCVDGEAPLDVWDATGADEVVVRLHWVDPTRTTVYLRRLFADPFLAVEEAEGWRASLDASVVVTPTKRSGQLTRQTIALGPPTPGAPLALGPATLARPWRCEDQGIRRSRLVALAPRRIGELGGVGPKSQGEDFDPARGDDLAAEPAGWAASGLPANVACTTLDLGAIGLHRVEVTSPTSPVAVCWSELPDFADTWATSNRVDVRMVDAVPAGARDAAPPGWRGGRYLHLLHLAGATPSVRAWRREYPLDWKALRPPADPRDRVVLEACRANLVACVDGGLVDTCWRERGQWTGDLRLSALALRALTTNDEVAALALRQVAASYVEEAAMVQAVWPATLRVEPLFIPGYHLAFCLAALEHGVARLGLGDPVRGSLEAWRARYLGADGLLRGFPATSWWFVDWDPQRGTSPRTEVADAVTHAWFAETCALLGRPGCDRAAFDRTFWTGSAWAVDVGGPASPQATAAAISAWPDGPHASAGLDWLEREHAAGRLLPRVTPYFGHFVAKALAVRSPGLSRRFVRDLYHPRAARWGTIPEKTQDGASLAHGWSIGVAALLAEEPWTTG